MPKTATKPVADNPLAPYMAMDDGVAKVMKDIRAAANFGHDNFQALVKTSRTAAKAVDGINATFTGYTKRGYEYGMAAAKDMTACQSVGELFEKQIEVGKVAMETMVAETRELSDIYAAAAKEFVSPWIGRFNAAMEFAIYHRA